MGITFVKVTITYPAKSSRAADHAFLFDCGVVYSVVREEVLRQFGIKPSRVDEYLLANGESVKRPVGNAFFELQDKVGAAPVVFGEQGIFLLGATALESMGLMLDPFRRELKPLPMLPMTHKKVHEL